MTVDLPNDALPLDDDLPSHAGFSFSLATVMLVMTLLAIGCGLLAAAPGLGVPFCILLAPVLLRTSLVLRRRREQGEHVPLGQKFALVGVSLVVATVIATITCVASVGTFCGICLGLYSVGGDAVAWPATIVAGLAAVFATVTTLVASTKWVRRRYERDANASGNDERLALNDEC